MYIYGKNVVKEKILSGEKIDKLYLSENFNDKDLLTLIRTNKIKYSFLPKNAMDRKVDGLHQGIIAQTDDVDTFDLSYLGSIKTDTPLVIMLDHLEDPHNFGAIVRTAEALGVDAIIIPSDRSVSITSTVVKTSAGAIYNVPIIKVVNLSATIKKLKDLGYWIVGTDMQGEDYTKIDYKMPTCVVIGNEGNGISKIISDNCDYIVKIPMVGKINSLNASVSCGIVIAHIVSSRNE